MAGSSINLGSEASLLAKHFFDICLDFMRCLFRFLAVDTRGPARKNTKKCIIVAAGECNIFMFIRKQIGVFFWARSVIKEDNAYLFCHCFTDLDFSVHVNIVCKCSLLYSLIQRHLL